MTERSVDQPHVVYAQNDWNDAAVFPNYEAAWKHWKIMQGSEGWEDPYLIAHLLSPCTVGQEGYAQKQHVVVYYVDGTPDGGAVFRDYASASEFVARSASPRLYQILTLGRHCTQAAEVVDVSE